MRKHAHGYAHMSANVRSNHRILSMALNADIFQKDYRDDLCEPMKIIKVLIDDQLIHVSSMVSGESSYIKLEDVDLDNDAFYAMMSPD